MTDAAYIHGTTPPEQERLRALNRLTNDAFVEFLQVAPGMRVLDVGAGLGILAEHVMSTFDDVHVVGVELSETQLAAAVRGERLSYVRADVHRLPFRAAAFDAAYARYVLEHVGAPAVVLAEMRRVVRPGGRLAVLENDISLVRVDPPCPVFRRVWDAFARLQTELGGDGLVGRRLYRLFRAAGLRDIELSVQPEVHWHGSPSWQAWVRNIMGNIAGPRADLITRGYCTEAEFDAAMKELDDLTRNPDGSATFMWNRASGTR